jgi:hypothetical protein
MFAKFAAALAVAMAAQQDETQGGIGVVTSLESNKMR